MSSSDITSRSFDPTTRHKVPVGTGEVVPPELPHFSTLPAAKLFRKGNVTRTGIPSSYQSLPRSSRLGATMSRVESPQAQPQLQASSLSDVFVDGIGLSNSYRSMVASHPNIDKFNTHPSDHSLPKRSQLSPPPIMQTQDGMHSGHKVLFAQWNTGYQSTVSSFTVSPFEIPGLTGLESLAATGQVDGSVIFYKLNSSEVISPSIDNSTEFKLSRYVIGFGPPQQVTSLQFFPLRCNVSLSTRNFWGLVTGTDQGDLLKWDTRDGRCLARLSPAAQSALKGNRMEKLIPVGIPFPSYLLCDSPGLLVVLNCDNLELVADLSSEVNWTNLLVLPSTVTEVDSGTLTVPILAKGKTSGELSLGLVSLPPTTGTTFIKWHCTLSLSEFDWFHWCYNQCGPTDGNERVLLVSRKSFVLLQVDSDYMVRQLTQYISSPNQETWVDGSFHPNHLVILRASSGVIYCYRWALDGSLGQLGVTKGSCDFPIFSIQDQLISLGRSSSGLRLVGWRHPSDSSDGGLQPWQGAVIETSEAQPEEPSHYPPASPTEPHTTVIIPVSLGPDHDFEEWIALGLSNGVIAVQSLGQLFFTPQNFPDPGHGHRPPRGIGFDDRSSEKWLVGHRSAITSLLAPSSQRLGSKHFLISGDSFGMIKIWELSSGVCLASFQGHSQPVSLLFQLPSLVDTRLEKEIQQLVISSGLDNSTAVFCLRRMVCLGLIPGHPYSIHQILYHPITSKLDNPIIDIRYEDDHVSSWYVSSLGLTLVSTEIAKPISTKSELMKKADWVCGIELIKERSYLDRKATITTYPLWDTCHEFPVLQVTEVDIRRLLGDLHSQSIATVRFLPRIEPIAPPGSKLAPTNSSVTSGSSIRDTSLKGTTSQKNDMAYTLSSAIVSSLLGSTFSPGLLPIKSSILQGIRGAGGIISLLMNSSTTSLDTVPHSLSMINSDTNPNSDLNPWELSPRFTASRLLPAMALSLGLFGDSMSKECCSLLGKDENFIFPCLGILARYWVDAASEIQTASQALFRTIIGQLSYTQQREMSDFWIKQLPDVFPEELLRVGPGGSAVLTLGILAMNYPELLSDSVTLQRIARGLEWLLSSHARATFRMVAIDIVSKGFMVFEPYLDGVWVLRTLCSLLDEAPRLTRQAVLHIASANTPLFITSLGLAKGPEQLGAIMRLIPYLIKQRQTLLFPYIPRVVEIIVKALDPKDLDVRRLLLPAATQCLHDLVATYANVAFHSESQRLAVGAMEGAAIVYDLRTSTRCLVVEGYVTPATAVAFSPDGKFLATFAHQESLVKIWNTSGGLLNMLSKSLRGHSPTPIPATPVRTRSPSSLAAVFLPSYLNSTTGSVNSATSSGRASPIHSSSSSVHNIPPASVPPSPSLGFFSTAPTPYRTFNVSLESNSPPSSPGSIMRTIELQFVGDRSLNLVTEEITLSFNI